MLNTQKIQEQFNGNLSDYMIPKIMFGKEVVQVMNMGVSDIHGDTYFTIQDAVGRLSFIQYHVEVDSDGTFHNLYHVETLDEIEVSKNFNIEAHKGLLDELLFNIYYYNKG